MSDIGRFLVIIGVVLVLLGGALWLAPKIPWLGRLPGDITIKRDNFTFYFPLGTSILISIVMSVIFWLFRR